MATSMSEDDGGLSTGSSTPVMTKICGCQTDCLILVDETSEITLFDTLTDFQFKLPPISTSLQQNKSPLGSVKTTIDAVHKAVLFFPGNDTKDFIVLAIYGESKNLVFYRSILETWTSLEEAGSGYDDITYHKGGLYAVDEYGKLVACDLKCPGFANLVPLTDRWCLWGEKLYLVSLGQELCVVVRHYSDKSDDDLQNRETTKVRVCGLSYREKKGYLVGKMHGWAVFLGQNSAVGIPPYSEGVMPDCIYVEDPDVHKGGHKTRVYSLPYQAFV
ncbi:hypothetical protein Tsubulata_036274 [Turnera subulata]|uniref:KIB1-4 beta-propeller domain-containing protein n=1 Tax=Turnera subulata TaxID=218843 RepID=A0A9Q0FZK1_9ROSI|nr:hypothetical protein Tsubulata_036274 [Turnera subulata]